MSLHVYGRTLPFSCRRRKCFLVLGFVMPGKSQRLLSLSRRHMFLLYCYYERRSTGSVLFGEVKSGQKKSTHFCFDTLWSCRPKESTVGALSSWAPPWLSRDSISIEKGCFPRTFGFLFPFLLSCFAWAVRTPPVLKVDDYQCQNAHKEEILGEMQKK